jgi:hypothetical protein
MNREKALAYRQRCLDESMRQREIVETIPQGQLLLVTYRNYFYHSNEWENMKVACEVKLFNLTSVRCLIYAAEFVTCPFQSDFDNVTHPLQQTPIHKEDSKDLQPLKFYNIIDWEPLPKEHLPLVLSYQLLYPRLIELLKGS